MKCPKCHASVTASPDAAGYFNCSGCGVKLKVPQRKASAEDQKKTARVMPPGPPGEGPPTLVPPGSPARQKDTKAVPKAAVAASSAQLDTLLREIREVRRIQEQILENLASRPLTAPSVGGHAIGDDIETVDADDLAPPAPASRQVLLVDDDKQTRSAAELALGAVGLSVRTMTDGSRVIEAIAERAPAAIVLEAELGGDMPARDLIDRIKATMEWVNIPIVLYTRRQIADENEARTHYGADGFVTKGPGSDVLLAGRVREVIDR